MTNTQEQTIPTLDTVDTARNTLEDLATRNDWVSVFWDRGWGDSGQKAEISIIVNGDGQKPLAHLTKDVYRALIDQHIVGENTLMTFKARRIHDYCSPPEVEPAGPNTTELAEQVIRRYMDAHPDQPIRAEFSRGISQGRHGPQVDHEVVATPAAAGGWWVLILPGFDSAAVSAQKPDIFGHDIIGGGLADRLQYPKTTAGEVDVDALAGDRFQQQLAAVVEAKVAVIAAEREANR